MQGPSGGDGGVDGVGALGFEAVEDAFLEFFFGEEDSLGVEVEGSGVGLVFVLEDGPGTAQAGGRNLGRDFCGDGAVELVFLREVGGAAGGVGGIVEDGEAQRDIQSKAMDAAL